MTAPIRYEFWSCDGNSLCMNHYSFVYIIMDKYWWKLMLLSLRSNPQTQKYIHHCHHYWTSESLLNLWECTQGSDIINKWVVHFVIVFKYTITHILLENNIPSIRSQRRSFSKLIRQQISFSQSHLYKK